MGELPKFGSVFQWRYGNAPLRAQQRTTFTETFIDHWHSVRDAANARSNVAVKETPEGVEAV